MLLRFLSRVGLVAVVAAVGAITAPAIAAADSLTVTPCNSGCTPDNASLTAGGASSFTITAHLTGSGSVSNVAIALTPGLAANLTANAGCLANAPGGTHSASCLAGTGSVTTNVPTTTAVDIYETAARPGDVAGFDVVDHTSGTTLAHSELSLSQIPPPATGAGQLQGILNLPIPAALQPLLAGGSLVLNVNGTMDAKPAIRMPTNCSPPVKTTLGVKYSTGPAITPASTDVKDDSGFQTTCAALAYAPSLSVAAQKDSGDNGIDLQTTITQAATEAANLHASLIAPSGTISSNPAALSLRCASPNGTYSNCAPVGTAFATTPLLPGSLSQLLSNGTAYLTGSGSTTDLVVRFPSPIAIVLVGAVNEATSTVTFATASGGLDLPDLPLTNITVILNGGPQALFNVNCAAPTGNFTGSFTAQNTKTASSNASLAVAGCGPPVVTPTRGKPAIGSKELTGLSKGKPHLKFTVKRNTLASALATTTVKLSGGLKFAKKLTKKLKGIKVTGAKIASAHLVQGQLVLALSAAGNKVTISLKPPVLEETSALKKKAKQGKVKNLKVTLGVTDQTNDYHQPVMTFKHPH